MPLTLSNTVLLLVLSVWGPAALAASNDAARSSHNAQMNACREKRNTPGLTPAEQRRAVIDCQREVQAAERADRTAKAREEQAASRERMKDNRMAAEMACVKEMKAAGTASTDKNEFDAARRECIEKKHKPRQDKIDECNEKAIGKAGDERKAFMRECLAGT